MQEARAPTDIMIWPGNQNGHYSFILSLVVTDFIWTKDDINTCNEGVEDVLHALWTCKSIQPVWDAEGWLHLYAIHHALLEYADFINKVFTLGVDHEPEGFAIIC